MCADLVLFPDMEEHPRKKPPPFTNIFSQQPTLKIHQRFWTAFIPIHRHTHSYASCWSACIPLLQIDRIYLLCLLSFQAVFHPFFQKKIPLLPVFVRTHYKPTPFCNLRSFWYVILLYPNHFYLISEVPTYTQTLSCSYLSSNPISPLSNLKSFQSRRWLWCVPARVFFSLLSNLDPSGVYKIQDPLII